MPYSRAKPESRNPSTLSILRNAVSPVRQARRLGQTSGQSADGRCRVVIERVSFCNTASRGDHRPVSCPKWAHRRGEYESSMRATARCGRKMARNSARAVFMETAMMASRSDDCRSICRPTTKTTRWGAASSLVRLAFTDRLRTVPHGASAVHDAGTPA